MDKTQFEDAVRRFRDTVYRTALHVTGHPQDAEDAVQEVFLRLYTAERPFEGPEHLRRWLLRVTVNVWRDALKSPWRRRRVSLEELPETWPAAVGDFCRENAAAYSGYIYENGTFRLVGVGDGAAWFGLAEDGEIRLFSLWSAQGLGVGPIVSEPAHN